MSAAIHGERAPLQERLSTAPPWQRGALFAGFLVLCVLFSVLTQGGFALRGDGANYLLMQQAWLRGWPSADAALIAQLEQRPDLGPNSFLTMAGADGRTYCLHFWFYPLLSAPFAALISLFGGDPLGAFLIVNLLCAAGAGVMIARSQALSFGAKALLALSFGATSLNWYGAWAHPEVFTACLLLVAALAFLEKRYLLLSLCAGAAALQNPSAILVLPVAALAALIESFDGRRLDFALLLDRAWKIAAGVGVGAIAPLFSLAFIGALNPIEAAGVFVKMEQVNPERLMHYLFGLDQGAIIGLPFVFLGIAAVAAMRAMKRPAPLQRADFLLLMALLITLPTLAQTNFNAGQYYVSRYVSWSLVPALAWLAAQSERDAKPVGAAWLCGLALYALGYCAYYLDKADRVGLGGIRYDYDAVVFKPWTRVLVDHAPTLYNPSPEVFLERKNGSELSASNFTDFPGFHTRKDGVITKAIDHAPDAGACPGGRLRPLHGTTIARAGAEWDLVYLNGEMRCARD